MAVDEASPTDKSKLVWTQAESSESLDAFLERNPPSTTRRAAGGDGWIWVRSTRSAETGANKRIQPSEASLIEAKALLDALAKRINEIEANKAIPRQRSKTSGPSKKMLKESAAEHCESELRRIGEAEWQCGKWMLFESEQYVDRTFGKLARSVIDGPLSKLPNARCHTVKVATADSQRADSTRGNRPPQQLVCVYFENFWNAAHATEVLECIVKEHAEIPSSAKADLYTMVGLDSNHPSNIRSTLYRPGELFNWDLMREWQATAIEAMKSKKDTLEKSKPKGGGDTNGALAKSDDASSSDIRATKARKVGLDPRRVPVSPAEFWPSPVIKTAAAPATVTKTNTAAPTTVSKADALAAGDDSETESESDFEAPKVQTKVVSKHPARPSTPPPSSSAVAAGSSATVAKSSSAATTSSAKSPSAATTSPQTPSKPRPEPQASIDRQRLINSSPRSPDEKVKKTPVVVMRTKKRDRFGRSDF